MVGTAQDPAAALATLLKSGRLTPEQRQKVAVALKTVMERRQASQAPPSLPSAAETRAGVKAQLGSQYVEDDKPIRLADSATLPEQGLGVLENLSLGAYKGIEAVADAPRSIASAVKGEEIPMESGIGTPIVEWARRQEQNIRQGAPLPEGAYDTKPAQLAGQLGRMTPALLAGPAGSVAVGTTAAVQQMSDAAPATIDKPLANRLAYLTSEAALGSTAVAGVGQPLSRLGKPVLDAGGKMLSEGMAMYAQGAAASLGGQEAQKILDPNATVDAAQVLAQARDQAILGVGLSAAASLSGRAGPERVNEAVQLKERSGAEADWVVDEPTYTAGTPEFFESERRQVDAQREAAANAWADHVKRFGEEQAAADYAQQEAKLKTKEQTRQTLEIWHNFQLPKFELEARPRPPEPDMREHFDKLQYQHKNTMNMLREDPSAQELANKYLTSQSENVQRESLAELQDRAHKYLRPTDVEFVAGVRDVMPDWSPTATEGKAAKVLEPRVETTPIGEIPVESRTTNDKWAAEYLDQAELETGVRPEKTPDMPMPERPVSTLEAPDPMQPVPERGSAVELPRTNALGRAFVDQYTTLRLQQEAIQKAGGKVRDVSNVDQIVRLFPGRVQRGFDLVEKDLMKPLMKSAKSGRIDLSVDGRGGQPSLDHFFTALGAEHGNATLAARGAEEATRGGMSNEVAMAYLDAAFNGPAARQYREIADLLQKRNETAERYFVDSGILSKETAQKLRDDWGPHWASQADIPEMRGISEPRSPGLGVAAKLFHRAEGRTGEANGVTAQTLSRLNSVILQAEKNRAMQSVARQVMDNPADHWGVATSLEQLPADVREKSGYVHFRMDGKDAWVWSKDENYTAALRRLSPVQINDPFLRAMNQTMRNGVTAFKFMTTRAPSYFVTNLQRDTFEAAVSNFVTYGPKTALKGLIPKNIFESAVAFHKIEKGGEPTTEVERYAKEYMDSGGRTSAIRAEDAQTIVNRLNVVLRDRPSVSEWVKAKTAFVSHYSDVVENATRLTTYINLRREGKSAQEAASYAKQVTIDFNQHGTLAPGLDLLWVFSSTGIKGTARTFKLASSPMGRRVSAALFGLGFAWSLMQRLTDGKANDGTDNVDNIPASEDARYLHAAGVKVPVAWGWGVPVYAGKLAEKVMHGSMKPTTAASRFGAAIIDAVNPFGVADSALQAAVPTVARPWYDVQTNTNAFGGPIYPTQDPTDRTPKPDSENYFHNASPTLVDFSRWMNAHTGGDEVTPGLIDVSPETIEYMLKFVGSNLGRDTLGLMHSAKAFSAGEMDQVTTRDIPILSRTIYSVDQNAAMRDRYNHLQAQFQGVRDHVQRGLLKPDANGNFPKEVQDAFYAQKFDGELKRLRKLAFDPTTPDAVKKPAQETMKRVVAEFNARYASVPR